MNGPVRSICPSVTPVWLCSNHCITIKFSGFLPVTEVTSIKKVKVRYQKVKVTEVNTQLSRFRTVTSVWIHIWWWNDAQNLVLFKRYALLVYLFQSQRSLPLTKLLWYWVHPCQRVGSYLIVCQVPYWWLRTTHIWTTNFVLLVTMCWFV